MKHVQLQNAMLHAEKMQELAIQRTLEDAEKMKTLAIQDRDKKANEALTQEKKLMEEKMERERVESVTVAVERETKITNALRIDFDSREQEYKKIIESLRLEIDTTKKHMDEEVCKHTREAEERIEDINEQKFEAVSPYTKESSHYLDNH